ncbi:MAG: hypothetical protein ABL967_10395 [Bryobacteraceae bacterium]
MISSVNARDVGVHKGLFVRRINLGNRLKRLALGRKPLATAAAAGAQ